MNLENIKEGMEIKNYKELCSLLGEKVKTGNSKKAQLEHWNNYFQYEKVGNKFIIKYVLSEDEIKEHEISRGRKSLYGNMIQVLLMDMLSKNKGNIIISKSSLSKQLGLVNDNYSLGYNNQINLSNYLNIGVGHINEFYNINNANITSIINTAVNSLHNRRVIDYEIVTMVKYHDKRNAHVATPFDRAVLTEIDKECMLEFGIESLEELEKYNTNKRYFELLKKRKELIESRTNIEYHYKAYDIVVNHKHIEQEKNKLTDYVLQEIDRLSTMMELNNTYANNAINNAEKRYSTIGKNSVRSSENYIPYFKELVQYLISLNSQKLTISDLKNIKSEVLNSLDLPF